MRLEEALVLLAQEGQQHRIREHESVPTMQALGRVVAADVISPISVPPADNTSMDGYAVRCADAQTPGVVLPVSQRIPAGHPGQPLAAGTAARIFTGAFVPPGADAVVMQEHTEAVDGGVRLTVSPTLGQWIRRAGEDVARGAVVLRAGQRVTPQAMGLAAGVGCAKVQVLRRVRVALMSTGDELVMPGEVAPEAMPAGAIYNSNRFTLMGLLQSMGCEVFDMGIVPDQLSMTREAIGHAAQSCDLIVSSGGVSVGEEDHVRAAVLAQGRLALWQLSIKPGKPLALGAVRRSAGGASALDGSSAEALFLGLPGNPVSSFVTFLLAATPLLAAMQGLSASLPSPMPLRADFAWTQPDTKRREFIRVRRNLQGGLDVFTNQSSGVLTSAVWGDGLVDVQPGQTVAAGDTVSFWPWSAWGLVS
jgi:molybdopterin molybdotransferase